LNCGAVITGGGLAGTGLSGTGGSACLDPADQDWWKGGAGFGLSALSISSRP
jgi:hypothetical protein